MKLDVSDEQMRTIVSGAILAHLAPEGRDEILRSAVVELMTTRDEGYGARARRVSKLQLAFENAVLTVAQDVAREMLTQDEALRAKIRGLMAEAWARAFDKEREATLTRVSEALVRAMTWEQERG